eukprot:5412406-Pyramimonas_sp.AAC.1
MCISITTHFHHSKGPYHLPPRWLKIGQGGSRWPPMAPKMFQEAPNNVPRRLQVAKELRKEAPKKGQHPPTTYGNPTSPRGA